MFLTNKEAIKILQNEREGLLKILDKSVPYERQKTLVALDMAIQALKDDDEMEVPELQRQVIQMLKFLIKLLCSLYFDLHKDTTGLILYKCGDSYGIKIKKELVGDTE